MSVSREKKIEWYKNIIQKRQKSIKNLNSILATEPLTEGEREHIRKLKNYDVRLIKNVSKRLNNEKGGQ